MKASVAVLQTHTMKSWLSVPITAVAGEEVIAATEGVVEEDEESVADVVVVVEASLTAETYSSTKQRRKDR